MPAVLARAAPIPDREGNIHYSDATWIGDVPDSFTRSQVADWFAPSIDPSCLFTIEVCTHESRPAWVVMECP